MNGSSQDPPGLDPDNTGPGFHGGELVVRPVGDEVIVYSKTTHRAYCLNSTLAAVWRAAGKHRSPDRILQQLKESRLPEANRELVCYGLKLLDSHKLLYTLESVTSSGIEDVSRRECLRTLGTGAAAILPVLAIVDVPEAFAQASDCGQQNDPCGPGFPPCCPGKRCRQTGQGPKCVG